MKLSIVKKVVVGLCILISVSALKAEMRPDPVLADIKVETSGQPEMVSVYANPVEFQKVTIVLKDMKGNLIWKTTAKDDIFKKRLYMGDLPDGNYLLNFKEKHAETVQPITVRGDDLSVFDAHKVVYNEPEWNKYGDFKRLKVSVVLKGMTTISVEDRNGDKVYESGFTSSEMKDHDFYVYFLDSGSYTVIINTPIKTFTRRVKIE